MAFFGSIITSVLMNGKRAIGYGAFHFNLWMVKAAWLVATKMYEKDAILVLNLMVLLICLVYLWFLWENVWLCFLLLWESSVSHLLEFSAITLTIHCHVATWEILWHQCFTAQLIDASLPMHCEEPTCNMYRRGALLCCHWIKTLMRLFATP